MRWLIATEGSKGVDSTITVGTEQLAKDLLGASLALAGFGNHRSTQVAGYTVARLAEQGGSESILSEDKSYTITVTVK